MGPTVGFASVLLAVLLAFPMAFVFERGGNSIVGPAILHTSSNAPAIILALPQDVMATALVMHMGVILGSIYLVFVLQKVGRFFGNEFLRAILPSRKVKRSQPFTSTRLPSFWVPVNVIPTHPDRPR